jgi:hypothetical protein
LVEPALEVRQQYLEAKQGVAGGRFSGRCQNGETPIAAKALCEMQEVDAAVAQWAAYVLYCAVVLEELKSDNEQRRAGKLKGTRGADLTAKVFARKLRAASGEFLWPSRTMIAGCVDVGSGPSVM